MVSRQSCPNRVLKILSFLAVHAMPVSVITEIGVGVDSRPSITVISHDLGLFWRAAYGHKAVIG